MRDIFKALMIVLNTTVGMFLFFIIFAAYVMFSFWVMTKIGLWGLIMFPIGIVACIVIYHKIR